MKTSERPPDGHPGRGIILPSTGRQRDAIAAFQHVLRLVEGNPQWIATVRSRLAIDRYRSGDTARARVLLTTILESRGQSFAVALVHAELGEREATITALRETDFDLDRAKLVRFDPVFDTVREPPASGRFCDG